MLVPVLVIAVLGKIAIGVIDYHEKAAVEDYQSQQQAGDK